ncbi:MULTISPECIES: dethiobiotin synthase [unclassified Cupriavidus]|uniref:dethiobiotin synthase n=1 Tax=unclassified Cupriavidus TaxID=2640874 RepID=UPI0004201609|nr:MULTISPECIES: dethiobiotin synthase [unclassified Cupriavidus]MBP0633577.1 dethiobiotin synthase [Cupriavidus sp. AcVe19-1a]
MIAPRNFACFVTGTDTGVGKTHASATLLHALHGAGYRTAGMKPVASGSEWRDGHWHNDDVAQLRAASSVTVPLGHTCPFLLRTPCSPHLAAAHEGVRITRAPIREAFDALRRQADAVVVEGVGGFHVPLDAGAVRWSTADLAVMLGLPVVMVVGIRLGCLNHAVLTAEAVRARGLVLAGWIANRVDPDMLLADENIATLHASLDAPCLGELPWQLDPAAAATRLDLAPLFAATAKSRAEAASLAA